MVPPAPERRNLGCRKTPEAPPQSAPLGKAPGHGVRPARLRNGAKPTLTTSHDSRTPLASAPVTAAFVSSLVSPSSIIRPRESVGYRRIRHRARRVLPTGADRDAGVRRSGATPSSRLTSRARTPSPAGQPGRRWDRGIRASMESCSSVPRGRRRAPTSRHWT